MAEKLAKGKGFNLSTIKGNEENPRTITEDKLQKLKNSIKGFEEMMSLRPIIYDEDMVALGGNMRLKALTELGYKEVPKTWVKQVKGLSEKQKAEFIIKDNVGFGEWEWAELSSKWENEQLGEWGLDIIGFDLDAENLEDGFSLVDGSKQPFQTMSFKLADEQVTQVKNALVDIKKTEEFKYVETFANENGNGNALYLIIMEWAEQKRLS